MDKANTLDTPLWTYACDIYQNKKQQKELLTLQDKYGCNINEMLYCMWLDNQNLAIELAQLNSRELHNIKAHIKRIRAVRRKVKNIAMIYPRMKSLELHYEKQHLYKLYKLKTKKGHNTAMLQLYRANT